jgi:hypothetical protein
MERQYLPQVHLSPQESFQVEPPPPPPPVVQSQQKRDSQHKLRPKGPLDVTEEQQPTIPFLKNVHQVVNALDQPPHFSFQPGKP